MYRTAPEDPGSAASFWRTPEEVTPVVFGLGTLAATTFLGVVAIGSEQSVRSDGTDELIVLGVAAVGALLWGLLAAAAARMPAWAATVLLLAACGLVGAPKLFIMAMGSMESMRPSLTPKVGEVVAVFSDLLLAASYAPVMALSRRLRVGDTEDRPLDLAAAACGWLGVVAALGVATAPGVGLRATSALILAFAVAGALRVRALMGEENAEAPVPGRLRGGLAVGAAIVGVGGALFLMIRVPEMVHTRSAAVHGIYAQRSMFDHCSIEPVAGGRDGVSLWRPNCGMPGPLLGWDEEREKVIEGDDLFARLPEARTIPHPGRP